MSVDDGLFDEPARRELVAGDRVLVHTMWGEERGSVLKLDRQDGFPVAHLAMDGGDRISINVAAVQKI